MALLKYTASEWIQDKCPQLGAALAYFTVFSLAPLVLVLLAVFGLIFGGNDEARQKITEQLQYLIDPSGIKVIQDIAANASKPQAGIIATTIGVLLALFGASGVFGQLQDALNTVWGVKPKPGGGIAGFIRTRFLSFAMVGGVCFLLLVSLTIETLLRGFNRYLQNVMPGGDILALTLFLIFDVAVVVLLFAMIFRYLPDAKIAWRERAGGRDPDRNPFRLGEVRAWPVPWQRGGGFSVWCGQFSYNFAFVDAPCRANPSLWCGVYSGLCEHLRHPRSAHGACGKSRDNRDSGKPASGWQRRRQARSIAQLF